MLTSTVLDPARDSTIVKLAREIAVDHYTLSDILKRYSITTQTWGILTQNPRFAELLQAETVAWNAALNTPARIRLKSAAVVEDWLETASTLLHSNSETLNSKIELAKMLGKFAALDTPEKAETLAGGDHVNITINIGDTSLYLEGGTDEPAIIDAAVNEDVNDFDWDQEFDVAPVQHADKFFEAAV